MAVKDIKKLSLETLAQEQQRPTADEAIRLHVKGESRFICDEPKPERLHYATVVVSPYAHARIKQIDAETAKQIDGVVGVFTWRDIPGENELGIKIKDEPLLPENIVSYIGQPVAVIVAATQAIAERSCQAVNVDYEVLEPILTIEQARAKNSLLAPEFGLSAGDTEKGFAESDYVLEGVITSCAQEHLYFETQRVRAIPGEGAEMLLQSSTQSPSEVQTLAARVLGVDRKDITVDVKRLGGAFGGKESAAGLWSCLAALVCYHLKLPIELKLSREQDMAWTGKRHPFESSFKVGFDKAGRIHAYAVEFDADGGACADLTMAIMQRAVLHAENAYHIPNIKVLARPLKTNIAPNTAFRGFGAPQGVFVIESVIQRIARKLGKDPLEIRKLNAYQEQDGAPYGQQLHEANVLPLLERLEEHTDYQVLKEKVREFNRHQRFIKRGIGIVPVKFGISFTTPFLNQGSALVHLYADGSVSVSHGGIEMGQSVNTKVARIVAAEMGVPLQRVKIESHNTKRTANTSPTAASTGADINGNAARNAAREIIDRLRPLAVQLLERKYGHAAKRILFENGYAFSADAPQERLTLRELAVQAWQSRIDLSAHGYYSTPRLNFDWETGRGTPFSYYVYGCGLVVAEVDLLTGYVTLKEAHLIHETAQTVDERVDRGQIEGAFIQGVGWCIFEEVVYDSQGKNLTESLTTYKIPAIGDIPEKWSIEMIQAEREFAGVKGSKAVGEPPFLYGEAAFFAVKDAIESIWDYTIEADLRMPATPESVLRAIDSVSNKRA